MSTWGRAQDALDAVLWGAEVSQDGEFREGLLHDLGWERVNSLTEPILEAVAPVFDGFWRPQVEQLRRVIEAYLHGLETESPTTEQARLRDEMRRAIQ